MLLEWSKVTLIVWDPFPNAEALNSNDGYVWSEAGGSVWLVACVPSIVYDEVAWYSPGIP